MPLPRSLRLFLPLSLIAICLLFTIHLLSPETIPSHIPSKSALLNAVHYGPSPRPVRCNPYLQPGLSISMSKNNTHYTSPSAPSCPLPSPPVIAQLQSYLGLAPSIFTPSNTTITDITLSSLENKTLLLAGDSVDRFVLVDLCNAFNVTAVIHPTNSYSNTTIKGKGGSPRSCFIPALNLTLASYFFYGFDEDDIWADKKDVYIAPGRYGERMDAFRAAVADLGKVDVVVVNVGLWELARYDRLLDEADEKDPAEVDAEWVAGYAGKVEKHLDAVRTVVGDEAEVVWRSMHIPHRGNKRNRYSPVKIRQLNEAAREVVTRWEGGKTGGWWGVGEAVSVWPGDRWMRDDIHPTKEMGIKVWGEPVLGFLAAAEVR